MIAVRPASARGSSHRAGVVIRHAFSCGDYYDPAHMGFGPVRVINEIEFAPGASLARERRANVEILDWVVEGRIRRGHDDASSLLGRGDAHLLGAGSGVDESLANASPDEPARVLQIWFQPDRLNAAPRLGHAAQVMDAGDFVRLACADGCGGPLALHRDIEVFAGRLADRGRKDHACCPGRRVWLQATRGVVEVNGVRIDRGDAAVALNETGIALVAPEGDAEYLLISLRGS